MLFVFTQIKSYLVTDFIVLLFIFWNTKYDMLSLFSTEITVAIPNSK